MKKIIMISALMALITTAFFACKKDKDEAETEEVYLNVPFVVQSDSTSFNAVNTLDSATLSSALGGNIDKITTLELLETKYVVTNYSGPVGQQISATLYVSDAGGADIHEIGIISNQNLASLVNNEQTLAMQQAGAIRFAELIKNSPHKAQLTFTGLTDTITDIVFVIAAIFKFKQHKDNPTSD